MIEIEGPPSVRIGQLDSNLLDRQWKYKSTSFLNSNTWGCVYQIPK